MKIKIIQDHLGEGRFPDFKKGAAVTLKEECSRFLHWFSCEIDGYKTYVPECFVRGGMQKAGDVLEVKEIVYSWIIAANENG